MALKKNTKTTKPIQKFGVGVNDARDFMPLLINGQTTPFIQLAKGVGSSDQYHPKRSVQKYLDTLEILQLIRVTDEGVDLLPSGRRFRDGAVHGSIVIRNSFATAPIPKSILTSLSQTAVFSRKDAEARLRAIDRSSETDVSLEWLCFAGLVEIRGEQVIMQETRIDPRALYSAAELQRLREQIYRRLAMIHDNSVLPGANCFHRTIPELLSDFRNAAADDAEPPMMRLVEAALFRLGFDVQVSNGPRDSGERLHFGPKGEDVVAFFLQPPAAATDSFNGLVISAELKRTSSDKKAVTQALAAAGRVTSYFRGDVAAFALTISDSETYADKVARDYANANNTPHLSIDTLVAVCQEQERRYNKASANLITPVDIWHVLNQYQLENYIEPQKDDFVQALRGSADK